MILSELPTTILALLLDGELSWASILLYQTGDKTLMSKLTNGGVRQVILNNNNYLLRSLRLPSCLKSFRLRSLHISHNSGFVRDLHSDLRGLNCELEELELSCPGALKAVFPSIHSTWTSGHLISVAIYSPKYHDLDGCSSSVSSCGGSYGASSTADFEATSMVDSENGSHSDYADSDEYLSKHDPDAKYRALAVDDGVIELDLHSYSWQLVPTDFEESIEQLSQRVGVKLSYKDIFTRRSWHSPNSICVLFNSISGQVDLDGLYTDGVCGWTKFSQLPYPIELAHSSYLIRTPLPGTDSAKNGDNGSNIGTNIKKRLRSVLRDDGNSDENDRLDGASVDSKLSGQGCKRMKSMESDMERSHECWNMNLTHPKLTRLKIHSKFESARLPPHSLSLLPKSLLSLSLLGMDVDDVELLKLSIFFPRLAELELCPIKLVPSHVRTLPPTLMKLNDCLSPTAQTLLAQDPTILPNLITFPIPTKATSYTSYSRLMGADGKWPDKLHTLALTDIPPTFPTNLESLVLSLNASPPASFTCHLPPLRHLRCNTSIDLRAVKSERWTQSLVSLDVDELTLDSFSSLPRSLSTLIVRSFTCLTTHGDAWLLPPKLTYVDMDLPQTALEGSIFWDNLPSTLTHLGIRCVSWDTKQDIYWKNCLGPSPSISALHNHKMLRSLSVPNFFFKALTKARQVIFSSYLPPNVTNLEMSLASELRVEQLKALPESVTRLAFRTTSDLCSVKTSKSWISSLPRHLKHLQVNFGDILSHSSLLPPSLESLTCFLSSPSRLDVANLLYLPETLRALHVMGRGHMDIYRQFEGLLPVMRTMSLGALERRVNHVIVLL